MSVRLLLIVSKPYDLSYIGNYKEFMILYVKHKSKNIRLIRKVKIIENPQLNQLANKKYLNRCHLRIDFLLIFIRK